MLREKGTILGSPYARSVSSWVKPGAKSWRWRKAWFCTCEGPFSLRTKEASLYDIWVSQSFADGGVEDLSIQR